MVHQDCAYAQHSSGYCQWHHFHYIYTAEIRLKVILNQTLKDCLVEKALVESIIAQEEVRQHGLEIMKFHAADISPSSIWSESMRSLQGG